MDRINRVMIGVLPYRISLFPLCPMPWIDGTPLTSLLLSSSQIEKMVGRLKSPSTQEKIHKNILADGVYTEPKVASLEAYCDLQVCRLGIDYEEIGGVRTTLLSVIVYCSAWIEVHDCYGERARCRSRRM